MSSLSNRPHRVVIVIPHDPYGTELNFIMPDLAAANALYARADKLKLMVRIEYNDHYMTDIDAAEQQILFALSIAAKMHRRERQPEELPS